MAKTLYMVIDTTKAEHTVIRAVAPIEQATLIGQTYMLEHPGRTCIAPSLDGRGFAKLDKLALQYLFWNTFQEKPNDDYGQLLKDCLAKALKIPVDTTDLRMLESAKSLADVAVPTDNNKPKKVSAPKAEVTAAPKKTSTCGFIWEICDSVLTQIADNTSKEFRQTVMQRCEAEGINKSTASVQLGRWKDSKLAK